MKEYLDLEERSELRHEYFDGEVFEIEAARYRHRRIGSRFLAIAAQALFPIRRYQSISVQV